MRLDQWLVDAAIYLMNRRFPPEAWAGAAAMSTGEGAVLTSLYTDRGYGSAGLHYETGAICEAHQLGHTVTASACVVRAPHSDRILILTPCGICQERLFSWGLTSRSPCRIPKTSRHGVPSGCGRCSRTSRPRCSMTDSDSEARSGASSAASLQTGPRHASLGYSCSRGSRASRRPSPTKVKARVMRATAALGATSIQSWDSHDL